MSVRAKLNSIDPMKSYEKDPYWTTARFAGKCAKTGKPFAPGDRIFYYPNGRQCFTGEAAEAAARDFESCAQDEAFMNGGNEYGSENY